MLNTDQPLKEVAEILKAEYPHLSVYEYGEKVKLTNGSAGYYINIYRDQSGTLVLQGRRHDETIFKRCDRDTAALLHTLRNTI